MMRFFQLAGLFFCLWLAAPAFGQAAPQTRVVSLNGITLELNGVSDAMEEPARLLLEKQIGLSGDQTVSPPLADDLAFFLQSRYLQTGYETATVDWQLAAGKVVLTVDEGRRRYVGKVTFEGVEASRNSELQPYLVRQTKQREGRKPKRLPFVEADIQAGTGLVVRRLQADGYLNAAAEAPVFTRDAKGDSVDILLVLKPGPQTLFGEVRLAGDLSKFKEDVGKKAANLSGKPFNEVNLETLRKELKGNLQSLGWYRAEVTSSLVTGEQQSGGAVPVVLTVLPGELFHVTEVRLNKGLSNGAQRVARSVFLTATQQRYAPETLDLLHRRALDTGIFDRLDVEPAVLSSNTMALQITGQEAKPKTLGFFGGYETFKGPFLGAEARHVNFMDTGDSVGVRAEASTVGLDGSLQWTDPAIFGSRNVLAVSLNAETFSFKEYERRTVALRNTLTRRITRRVTAELFQNTSLSAAESTMLTLEELGPRDYSIISGGGRLTLDFRDNPLNPRRGWLAGISMEAGVDKGDADLRFVRTDINASWYHPFNEKWRMAVAARSSSFNSSEPVTEVPIEQRLFNGGATTVRSFSEREMGPESQRGSTPLGGLSTTVLNAELSYMVISNLEVAGFVDAGSVNEEASLFSPGDLRYAIGMGIRYQLPIGPLRIDYGYNPNRKEGEKAGALHLTFGFAF
ncbi:MAG: outer membrane protein assembly factor [Verrucomicrobiales bacterium]|nr:outer membrane protein assembly factor [Verrucomicrobiales bacterium]